VKGIFSLAFQVCVETLEERHRGGLESLSLYAYPPEVENDSELPPTMMDKLDKGAIRVAVWSLSEQREKQKFTVAVDHRAAPDQVIREALYKRIRAMKNHTAEEKEKVSQWIEPFSTC